MGETVTPSKGTTPVDQLQGKLTELAKETLTPISTKISKQGKAILDFFAPTAKYLFDPVKTVCDEYLKDSLVPELYPFGSPSLAFDLALDSSFYLDQDRLEPAIQRLCLAKNQINSSRIISDGSPLSAESDFVVAWINFDLSSVLYHLGYTYAALSLANYAASFVPEGNRYDLYHLMAKIYTDLESPEATLAALNKAEQYLNESFDSTTKDEFYFRRAEVYLSVDENEKAILDLKEAISINPGSAEAHLFLADLLYVEADHKGAAKEYERGILLNPELALNYQAYSRVFDIAYSSGDYQTASFAATMWRSMEPLADHINAILFTKNYYRAGNYDQTLHIIQKKISFLKEKKYKNPEDVTELENLKLWRGVIYTRLGEFRKAYKDLKIKGLKSKKWKKYNEDFERTFGYDLALVMHKLGEDKEGIRLINKAVIKITSKIVDIEEKLSASDNPYYAKKLEQLKEQQAYLLLEKIFLAYQSERLSEEDKSHYIAVAADDLCVSHGSNDPSCNLGHAFFFANSISEDKDLFRNVGDGLAATDIGILVEHSSPGKILTPEVVGSFFYLPLTVADEKITGTSTYSPEDNRDYISSAKILAAALEYTTEYTKKPYSKWANSMDMLTEITGNNSAELLRYYKKIVPNLWPTPLNSIVYADKQKEIYKTSLKLSEAMLKYFPSNPIIKRDYAWSLMLSDDRPETNILALLIIEQGIFDDGTITPHLKETLEKKLKDPKYKWLVKVFSEKTPLDKTSEAFQEKVTVDRGMFWGRYLKALADFDEAKTLEQEYAYKNGKSHLEKAIELHSDNFEAKADLVWHEFYNGNFTENYKAAVELGRKMLAEFEELEPKVSEENKEAFEKGKRSIMMATVWPLTHMSGEQLYLYNEAKKEDKTPLLSAISILKEAKKYATYVFDNTKISDEKLDSGYALAQINFQLGRAYGQPNAPENGEEPNYYYDQAIFALSQVSSLEREVFESYYARGVINWSRNQFGSINNFFESPIWTTFPSDNKHFQDIVAFYKLFGKAEPKKINFGLDYDDKQITLADLSLEQKVEYIERNRKGFGSNEDSLLALLLGSHKFSRISRRIIDALEKTNNKEDVGLSTKFDNSLWVTFFRLKQFSETQEKTKFVGALTKDFKALATYWKQLPDNVKQDRFEAFKQLSKKGYEAIKALREIGLTGKDYNKLKAAHKIVVKDVREQLKK